MAAADVPPEPIEPEVAEQGPDWTLILTRSLALVAVGLLAGVLLSRPWAPRDEPAPTPTVSVAPSPSSTLR